MEWDKGFEAVRDNPGLCVDKHFGNVSPLPSLSFHVALRMFYFRVERPVCMNSRQPCRFDSAHEMQENLQPADLKRSVHEDSVLYRVEISKNCPFSTVRQSKWTKPWFVALNRPLDDVPACIPWSDTLENILPQRVTSPGCHAVSASPPAEQESGVAYLRLKSISTTVPNFLKPSQIH